MKGKVFMNSCFSYVLKNRIKMMSMKMNVGHTWKKKKKKKKKDGLFILKDCQDSFVGSQIQQTLESESAIFFLVVRHFENQRMMESTGRNV